MSVPHVSLRDGNKMPLFGLGCWALQHKDINTAVTTALENNYTLFDTAICYGNETEVAQALRENTKSRSDYFIVTKFKPTDFTPAEARAGLLESLRKMKLDYVDLFLIHTPRNGGKRLIDVWRGFCDLKNEGLTKSIGVSNFNASFIKALIDAGLVVPSVNQIEMHPWNQYKDMVKFCRQNNIAIMGYCPLGRCRFFDGPLKSPLLEKVAEKYKKSKAQILLRWAVQNNIVTIPKSSNPKRIIENVQLFDWSLEDNDLTSLDSLDKGLGVSVACSAMLKTYPEE